MSFTSDYFEQQKKKKKKEKTGHSFTDEFNDLQSKEIEKKVSKVPYKSIPVASDEDDIAPVKVTTTEEKEEKQRTWFQKGAFEDGYQFGDVTKTILGTAGDTVLGAVKGVFDLGEGLIDLGAYGVAGAADKFGADDFADKLRKTTMESQTETLFGGASKFLDNYSVLGDKSESVLRGVGQVGGIILTGGIGTGAGLSSAGATALTTGVIGASGMGSGMSEAYQGGATDKEAAVYGLSVGAIEAGTEMLFGGLGKTVNAVGLSKGISSLDDAFAKRLSSKIANQTAKNFVEFGVKSSAEGFEEVLSGIGSSVAKKLTYMTDEELTQIIEDENLLEQFVVGAVSSSIAQSGYVPGMYSGSVREANKTGTDFITGLTQSEQKVIDKEYENRITEAEKDGTKLTEKEKSKIYDSVLSDMEKGYIDTDTIESVLGGEDYSNYQNELKRQQDIDNELKELRNMKSGDMTDIQAERMAELKAMKPNTEMVKSLKFNVDEKIRNALSTKDGKGSRLLESYNERSRRGQQFEADISKYDEKQKAVIQKAIDSGILNNTNRTHEFVDFLARMSADKGVLFDFLNNEKLKGTSFARDDAFVNGYYDKNSKTIGVNIDSAKAVNSTVGHEITHVLEGTELYGELQNTLFEYAKTKGEYDSRRETLAKLYAEEDIDSELAADLVGDYLFQDSEFINHLSVSNRNVFQKIYDEIKYLYKIATAGSTQARELERVKRAFDKAYNESAKGAEGTKYSVSEGITEEDLDLLTEEDFDEILGTKWISKLGYKVSEAAESSKPRYKGDTSTNGKVAKLTDERINRLFREYGSTNPEYAQAYITSIHPRDFLSLTLSDESLQKWDNATEKGTHEELYPLDVEKLTAQTQTPFLEIDTRTGEVIGHEGGHRMRALLEAGVTDVPIAVIDYRTKYSKQKEASMRLSSQSFSNGAVNGGFNTEIKNLIPLNEVNKNEILSAYGGNGDIKYSLSDSDGKALTKEQSEYFKDSKMRDDNGNLMVMYHGSQDAGFHTFDAKFSDDDTSFFFVDRNDVAATYSGTTETYAPGVMKTAEDVKRFIATIVTNGKGYDVVEKDGKFTLYYKGEEVADSDTAQGIYEEFCDFEGVGYGDANYKVYLNLKNPLMVDAQGGKWNDLRNWSKSAFVNAEDVAVKRVDGEFRLFDKTTNSEIENSTVAVNSYTESMDRNSLLHLMLDKANYALSINTEHLNTTRDVSKWAKAHGYDGVIFKNIHDNGGYSNGSEGASTVAIAFESNQIKSVANDKPTVNPDIRYSLSEDSEGRKLSDNQAKYFEDSKVVDDNGNLKVVYHGSPTNFNEFSLNYLGTNGTNEGYGFYFTDSKRIAEGYSKGEGNSNGRLFETYLDIKKPLSDTEVTMSRAQFKKLLIELNNQVDADGEKLDILSNYGDVEWEGLNKVLNYAIELEYDGNDNDVDIISSLVNSSGNLETVYRVLREVTGYDGIIVKEAEWGGDQTIYIAFHPEQIKNTDNLNPTDNPDIHRSLSAEGEQSKRYGDRYTPATELRYDAPIKETAEETVAPVAEEDVSDTVEYAPEIEPNEPSLYELRQRQDELLKLGQEAMQNDDADAINRIMAEYEENAAKIEQFEAEEAERFNSLDDADAPPEMAAPYFNESEEMSAVDPFENRDIKAVGDRKVKAYMYENPEVKPFFQREAGVMLNDLQNSVKGERWYVPEGLPGSYGAESYGHYQGTSRHTTDDIAYLLDKGKGNGKGYTYAEIEKGLKAIIEDNGQENNACSKRIEFLLNDRLMGGYQDLDGYNIPADQDYINLLNEKQITEYTEEARKSFLESVLAEDIAPVAETVQNDKAYEAIRPQKPSAEPRMKRIKDGEDVAPLPTYETTKNGGQKQRTMFPDGKTAEVLTDEPKVDKKKPGAWSMFKNNVLDKGMVFEDLALETGNRELQARWNSIRYAEGKAQKLIGEGNASVSSLNSIREAVENTGKTQQFYEYLYHKHNVDRMSLESKAAPKAEELRGLFVNLKIEQIKAIAAKEITDKTTEKTADTIRAAREYLNAVETKNKPVFGDAVTAEISRETADKLEKANPEFKELAQEVYDYMNYLREMMVDNGVISSDTAKLWAEIYPHYVPIRRAGKDGAAINVPLDTGRTGVNAPIKGATGGNSDILPLFDTMGQRTIQTYRAIAKNRFGVELKNTLGTTISNETAGVDDTIDSVDTQDGLLQEGKNGNSPTFTVFENGERVTFEITEEMYDAMKPTSKGLSYTNKVANTVGNVFRGLLTEYNPVFMTTNAVKDVQDILINSQHAARTYAAIPKAIGQMATKGRWYQEYLNNGGEQNTYFDNYSNTFKEQDKGFKKIIGMPLRAISTANNFIEKVPRLAEYIASREAGRSVDVSMLDAARVTTNFAAGGDVTKFLNRNGFNFINASTQGAIQQVRNVREAKANGLKGWMQLATKVAIAGVPVMILNNLLWDDDEEYEELSEYVKDNYYIVAKFDDGKFVRIPKGRTLAVIQDAFEQMENLITGDDEVDLKNFLELAITNLAPNNPLDNNIIAPISQVLSNRTWYGEELVPTRLQDLPAAEQYDESTDSISKWLGEKLNVSPYKINYLLNQYSGGVGDVFLPMLTPEAESGNNSFVGNLLAPFKDKFTTDYVMNNQNVSDFYTAIDELTANAKSSKATDEDMLSYKYMNSVNADLSELYKQKREIQNSGLSDDVKYLKVRNIQEQIVELTKEGLNTYQDISYEDDYRAGGEYARVGDKVFKKNDEGEWEKLSDEQLTKYEVTKAAGDASYATDGTNHYRWYVPEEDSDTEPGWKKITDEQLEKQDEVTKGLGISAEEYWSNKDEYDYAYKYPENYAVAKAVGGYNTYKTYSSELYDIKADKDSSGKSISGSRKEKVIEYVNGLDIDYGARLIIFKNEYNADDTYNYEIIDYLNSREDISYEEMETILKELGFTVDSKGNITWD